MRIRDWSSDVCSSDLPRRPCIAPAPVEAAIAHSGAVHVADQPVARAERGAVEHRLRRAPPFAAHQRIAAAPDVGERPGDRKSVVEGKSGSVRVDHSGLRYIQKNTIIPKITYRH